MLSVFRDLSDGGRISVMQFARFIHADEHHWVQANLLDRMESEGIDDGRAAPHSRPDRLTRSLFETDTVRPPES